MPSWAPPTPEDLTKVAALAARPENRAYFFDRLENPRWVKPLADRGFFADPPPPMPTGDGYVRFPPWPEGHFLERVASEAPDDVADVLAQITGSESPTVTKSLLRAAKGLPSAPLAKVAPRVAAWVDGDHLDFFADDASAAVNHLLAHGLIDYALAAMRSLLAVRPDPRRQEKADRSDLPFRPTLDAAARVSEWHYSRLLAALVPAAVDTAGLVAVELLANLLHDAVRHSNWDDTLDSQASYAWRPAIEDHAQNSDDDVKDALVSALRDAALRFARRGPDAVIQVIDLLEPMGVVHSRIALHVLAQSDAAADLAGKYIADSELFDDYTKRHEYAELLRRRFGDITPEEQAEYFRLIDSGPDLEEYRSTAESARGQAPTEEDVQRHADLWLRDRYSFVNAHLMGERRVTYMGLVERYGAPEHPDFMTWSSSWSGPESPISADELAGLGPERVLEYLATWVPDSESGWHFGPSVEGLGRAFQALVARGPDSFALPDALGLLDSTYVRSYLAGVEAALREGSSIDWSAPLRVARAVLSHSIEVEDQSADRDRDPGWSWSRRQIASLLRTGLVDKSNGVPPEFADEVWRLASHLAEDPDPTVAHESQYGGDNMDPLTLSINSTRGTALHAVVEYGLWRRRQLDAAGEISLSFDAMPEVRQVLDRHLDASIDPSLAVRSVYGRWFPWLLLLDEEWATDNVTRIFGADDEPDELGSAAWDTYVKWCPPYDAALRALRERYDAEVARVRPDEGERRHHSPAERLGEHLATYFWRGLIPAEWLVRFADNGGDELAGHMIEFIGRSLRGTSDAVSPTILEQLASYWSARLANLSSDVTGHEVELAAFAVWFSSAKFDDDLSLQMLEAAVERVALGPLAFWTLERMAELAPQYPRRIASALETIVKQTIAGWDHVGWRDEAKSIAGAVLVSGDSEAVTTIERVIDQYVRRGELDFRDLLGGRA